VERIDTAALVALLQEGTAPVLVDVSPDPQMVPGALALLGSGLSFADEAKEAAYHQRFSGLVRAAAPDAAQPLVFYGGARAGWLSAHAALRAVQAGYTRVYWYRGGLSAWQSAGLPSVGKVALGVVY
jgi:rhodanese-related sulfurtransferase